jgi:hypothetical protein
MIFHPLAPPSPAPTPAEIRQHAFRSAIVLRDCSLRRQTTPPERKACRLLMRQAAQHWRSGTTSHGWAG